MSPLRWPPACPAPVTPEASLAHRPQWPLYASMGCDLVSPPFLRTGPTIKALGAPGWEVQKRTALGSLVLGTHNHTVMVGWGELSGHHKTLQELLCLLFNRADKGDLTAFLRGHCHPISQMQP